MEKRRISIIGLILLTLLIGNTLAQTNNNTERIYTENFYLAVWIGSGGALLLIIFFYFFFKKPKNKWEKHKKKKQNTKKQEKNKQQMQRRRP